MAVELSTEIWNELKRYINSVDRSDAAEALVSILIDNDMDADEIKHAFKGDNDIKRALIDYLKEDQVEEDEDDDDGGYDDY